LHATNLGSNDLLLTADTLVYLDGKVLGKPADKASAFNMLQQLSGKAHKVITGVCLFKRMDKVLLFKDETLVYFRAFDMKELEYYVDNYPVLDKAGAYGVQDWIGTIGIEKIEGSFYNVMGLPMHLVYLNLKYFANH
jgi:septum formation protein